MELLTYKEAAQRLGFKSSRVIRSLVKAEKLKAVYPLPHSPRIPDFELDKYILGISQQRNNETCTQTEMELDALLIFPSRTPSRK